MENALELASEYLQRVRYLKAVVIDRFVKKESLSCLPVDDLFRDVLVSSSLRAIVLTFYASGFKTFTYLKEDLPCFGHSIICHLDTIFLIAGCSHFGEPFDTVYTAKFFKNQQKKLQLVFFEKSGDFSLKVKRKFCTSLLYNHKIFVFGGRNLEARDSFEVIDLQHPGSRSQVYSMTARTGYLNSTLFQDQGFVISSDSNQVEVFNLQNFNKEPKKFVVEGCSGLVFIHISKEFWYFITVENNLIVFHQNQTLYSLEVLDFRVSWMQTYATNDEVIIFYDISTNQIRVISLIRSNI